MQADRHTDRQICRLIAILRTDPEAIEVTSRVLNSRRDARYQLKKADDDRLRNCHPKFLLPEPLHRRPAIILATVIHIHPQYFVYSVFIIWVLWAFWALNIRSWSIPLTAAGVDTFFWDRDIWQDAGAKIRDEPRHFRIRLRQDWLMDWVGFYVPLNTL